MQPGSMLADIPEQQSGWMIPFLSKSYYNGER